MSSFDDSKDIKIDEIHKKTKRQAKGLESDAPPTAGSEGVRAEVKNLAGATIEQLCAELAVRVGGFKLSTKAHTECTLIDFNPIILNHVNFEKATRNLIKGRI